MQRLLFSLIIVVLCAAVPAHATNLFWHGSCTGSGGGGGASCTNGTFKWDSDSGTGGLGHRCWGASSGGGSCQALPGSGDVVNFDANSGTLVTVNAPNNASGAAQVNVLQLGCGSFGGTLDFSAFNNNVTIGSTGFSCSGTGVRTLNLGNGTWTMGGNFTLSTATNLTFNANSSNIVFTAPQTGLGGASGLTFATVTFTNPSGAAGQVTGGGTIGTLVLNGGTSTSFASGVTYTINNLTTTASPTNPVQIISQSTTAQPTLTTPNPLTLNWMNFNNMAFATTGGGSWTINNSYKVGNTSGATVNNPQVARVIGGGF